MHRSEDREEVPCSACGAPIPTGAPAGFRFGAEQQLCWQCAVDRGGSYDANHDSWVTEPDVADLSQPER